MRNVIILIVLNIILISVTNCSKDNEIIKVLSEAKLNYVKDGACEPEILFSKDILDIVVKYKENIIPTLIKNMTSCDKTNSNIDNNNIPLGFLCFDLLCSILIKTEEFFNYYGYFSPGFWTLIKDEYRIPIEEKDWNYIKVRKAKLLWAQLSINNKLIINWEYINKLRYKDK